MAMTLVSTVTVGSGGAASIEFTNIPQTGKDLLILWSFRSSIASASIYGGAGMTLNGGTPTSSSRRLRATNSTVSSNSTTNASFIVPGYANYAGSTSNTFSNNDIYISNYTSTTTKSMSFNSVAENNAADAAMWIAAEATSSSAAITSLLLDIGGDTIAQHSTASLYIIS
jgi:hypothetical protein